MEKVQTNESTVKNDIPVVFTKENRAVDQLLDRAKFKFECLGEMGREDMIGHEISCLSGFVGLLVGIGYGES